MKGLTYGLFAAMSTLTIAASAQAAVIINDNFDGYADQAAFEAVWTPIGTVAPQSGVLTTAQASSPTKSIHGPVATANGQYRNQATFAETSTFSSSGNLGIGDQLIWSFDFYDSLPTGAPQRNHSNLQDGTAPGATNQLVAMGMNNNQLATQAGGQFYQGRILGYTPPTVDPDGGPDEVQSANLGVNNSGMFFKLNDFGVGARSLGWHNLKVILTTDDGLSTDYAFYVDNQLAERVNDVGTAASIRSYDVIRMGSGLTNGTAEVFYDNMYVEYIPVPEPTSLALFGLAGAGLLIRRRRA